MKYTCTVCGFDGLEEPPANFTICPSCGTEFGYTDFLRGHDDLRARWIAKGMTWHSTVIAPPYKWSGMEQLMRAGHLSYSFSAEDTQREVVVVEVGEHDTIIDMSGTEARVNFRDKIIHLIVNNLVGQTRSVAA